MAAFSLRVVAPVRGYHAYKETWEPSLADRVNFEQHNGRRLPYRRTYNLQKRLCAMFVTFFC